MVDLKNTKSIQNYASIPNFSSHLFYIIMVQGSKPENIDSILSTKV